MEEHEYYNIFQSAGGTAYQARQEAMAFSMQLLVNHLHEDHNMTVRQIAIRFKRKEKEVKALLYKKEQ